MADTSILTNVDFSFRRGLKSNYKQTAVKDGSLNICIDTAELYADIDGRRIPLSGVIVYETESEIFALELPEPCLYYAINTNILYHYDASSLRWTQLTDGTADEGDTGFVTSAVASGNHSIIFYRGNGSTFEVNTQDLDTTYSTGTTNYSGLTRLYSSTGTKTDGTIRQKELTTLLNGKVSSENGVAPFAVKDSEGQDIHNTYIKDVEVAGRDVTFTKGDGSTLAIRTQDTNDNTTYSTGNSTYSGLSKLYPNTGNNTDGTMTQKAIQEALDGKVSTAGTAYAAEFDHRGQNIANTYIKSIEQNVVDPHIFTITWGNNTTSTIETVDNNDTYSAATANKLGLTKLYSTQGANQDGAMTQAALTSALNTKLATTATAAGAVNDGLGQEIDTNYIKNVTVDGQVVTFTRGDGSTFSIITQDTNIDTYGPGTSATLGFTKLYYTLGTNIDGTINQKSLTNFLNNKLPTTGTAARSIADSDGQKITETYIKNANASGQDVTFTRGDGSTFKIITQDYDTTYTLGTTDTLGLVKLYNSTGVYIDGTMTQGKITSEINNVRFDAIVAANYSTDSEILEFTKGDGGTFSYQMNNTTYDTGTTAATGLTKLYSTTGTKTDGTIRQKELSTLINSKLNSTATAVAANKDNKDQVIDETYIKAMAANGTTITVAKGDNSTFTINTKDTTYATATSATSGLTLHYNSTGANVDGTMTQKAISDAINLKLDKTATAVAANKDNKNQVIDETYIKDASVSGQDVTFTKGDGTTFKVTTQDNNTTYAQATSSALGLVRLYASTGTSTNGTMTRKAISDALSALDTKIANLHSFEVVVLTSGQSLPSTGTSHTIYFVPDKSETGNVYTEYLWVNNNYEKIGDTTIDLSDYPTSSQVNTSIAGAIVDASVDGTEITFTKKDNSTFKITTQDNNTTYAQATSSALGLVKLYTSTGTSTDGTMTRKSIKDALDGKLATNGTAASATNDSSGQKITDTYIKNFAVSGNTITITKGDNSTIGIETEYNLTTYSTGTSTSAGLTKLYSATGTNTDGAMTQNAVKSALDNTVVGATADDTIVTFNRANGTSFNITTKDTTYSTGTSTSAGLTKLYTSTGTSTDGTMTRNAIKTALDGKLATNSANFLKNISANQTTVTVTKGDNSTFTFNTKDTTYSTGTSTSAGLTKLYTSTGSSTDGAMTRKATSDEIAKYVNKVEQDSSNSSVVKITKGDGSTTSFTLPTLATTKSGIVTNPNSGSRTNEYYLAGNCSWVELNTTIGGLVKTIELASTASNDDIVITNRNNSTYSLNLSDYGYEGDDNEDDDLTVGGTITTFVYNGSTYSYRMGQVGKDQNGNPVDIVVVNNSTFEKSNPADEEVTYNDTNNYANIIN